MLDKPTDLLCCIPSYTIAQKLLHLRSIPHIVTQKLKSKTHSQTGLVLNSFFATECVKVKVPSSLLKLPWKSKNSSGYLLGYFSTWNQNECNSNNMQPGRNELFSVSFHSLLKMDTSSFYLIFNTDLGAVFQIWIHLQLSLTSKCLILQDSGAAGTSYHKPGHTLTTWKGQLVTFGHVINTSVT